MDCVSLRRLNTEGVACLELSSDQQEVSNALFESFASALPRLRSAAAGAVVGTTIVSSIPDGAPIDAHCVTGYHSAGVLPWSYSSNRHREGLVWSRQGDNGCYCGNKKKNDTTAAVTGMTAARTTEDSEDDDDLAHFFYWAERMERMLHDIAVSVLEWIESYLELPPRWFRGNLLGNPNGDESNDPAAADPHPYRYHHQWHLKNYVFDAPTSQRSEDPSPSAHQPSSSDPSRQWDVVLPVHTDPSLVSVVILDRPGRQSGGQGLQYWDRSASQWREVECSGHGVAVVLIGSVLSRITGGHLHAPKHRVVTPTAAIVPPLVTDDDDTLPTPRHRRAATLFLRPAPEALLRTPPSPLLLRDPNVTTNVGNPALITFGEWTSRVSKNYRRRRKTPNDKS